MISQTFCAAGVRRWNSTRCRIGGRRALPSVLPSTTRSSGPWIPSDLDPQATLVHLTGQGCLWKRMQHRPIALLLEFKPKASRLDHSHRVSLCTNANARERGVISALLPAPVHLGLATGTGFA